MNPEKQRIAMARLCGSWIVAIPHHENLDRIPNYVYDLNAIARKQVLLETLNLWVEE